MVKLHIMDKMMTNNKKLKEYYPVKLKLISKD